MKWMVVLIMMVTMGSLSSAQNVIELNPVKDNTLYESITGATSNGAGIYLFAGKTNNGSVRRVVMEFDVAANVPSGATIDSVQLTLTVTKTQSGIYEMSLYTLNSEWGEGTSDAGSNEGQGATATTGDATWLHTFSNDQSWTSIGGDFNSTSVGTTPVGSSGSFTWSSTGGMVQDVQNWLDNPGNNHGWLLRGDEENNQSAKRFGSRENSTSSNRPVLTIYYTPASTSANDVFENPNQVELSQNYPNPFNPTTQIGYTLPGDAVVSLKVFNAIGQEVATLVDQFQLAGNYNVSFQADYLPAGLYIYKLTVNKTEYAKKMMLVK